MNSKMDINEMVKKELKHQEDNGKKIAEGKI